MANNYDRPPISPRYDRGGKTTRLMRPNRADSMIDSRKKKGQYKKRPGWQANPGHM